MTRGLPRRSVTCLLFAGILGWEVWNALMARPAAAASDDQAARRADQAFLEAVAKSDKTALDELLDTDFAWTDAEGDTRTRAGVLQDVPKPGISGGNEAETTSRTYGDVVMIQAHRGRTHVLRIWVKRPAGWRLLVYQEARLMSTTPTVVPGTGKTCDNPCKTVPYQPKNEVEREVVTNYEGLQTATVFHDPANWGKYVTDEFVAASSNTNKLLDKQGRMADLARSKMAGVAPVPVVSMQLFDFPDAVVIVSRHQPVHGKALHITRLWIRRNGKWQETAAYQTSIQAASAAP